MKRSDEQQRPAETSASDPDREGWRQTFDGDLVKAQERFRRVAKLYDRQRRDAEPRVVSSGRFSLRRIRYARPGGRLQERAVTRAEDAPEAFYLDLPGAG